MDMRRFLKPSLTVSTLQALGGEYEGVIASVTDEEMRNRFTGQKAFEPVVTFDDGKRLVLNKGVLLKCITWFGPDSASWVGRRLKVFLHSVPTVNRETGEMKTRVQRNIACEDPHARAPILARRVPAPTVAPVHERELGDDDE
jgi:hypothetical protein